MSINTKERKAKMNNNINLRAYAKLVHKGQVLGYRFTSGFLREYIDIPIDEVAQIFGKKTEEIKTYKKGYMTRDIFPFLNKQRGIFLFFDGELNKTVNVDEKMNPLRVWEKTITVHKGGYPLKQPVKNPTSALKLTEMMDSLVYGTDFLEAFSIMSVKEMDLFPETIAGGKFGIELGNAVYGCVNMWTSLQISKISEEEIRNEFNIWCEDNNIKGVNIGIRQLKNIYEIQLHFCLDASPDKDSKVPLVNIENPNFLNFGNYSRQSTKKIAKDKVEESFLPLPFEEHQISHPDRTIYLAENGDAYNFFNEKSFFIKETDVIPEKKFDFSKYSYTFSRMIVRGNEIFDLDIAKSGNWCKANIIGGTPDFTRIMNKLCSESFLGEIIIGKKSNLPKVEVIDSKNGSIVLEKEIDLEQFGALPHEEIFAEVEEAWNEQIYGWSAWGWKKEIKNLVPEIIFAENNITFKVNIAL